MAEDSGSNSFMGVIVGVLLVLVLVGGFFVMRGGALPGSHSASIKIEAPKVGAPG